MFHIYLHQLYIYIKRTIIYILSRICLIQIMNGCIKISFDSAKHTWNIRLNAFMGFNNIKCLWSLFLPYIKLLFPLFPAIKSFTIAFVFSMHFFKSIKFKAQSWTRVKFLICFKSVLGRSVVSPQIKSQTYKNNPLFDYVLECTTCECSPSNNLCFKSFVAFFYHVVTKCRWCILNFLG